MPSSIRFSLIVAAVVVLLLSEITAYASTNRLIKQTEIGELKAAQPVSIEISNGEAHEYRISLKANQYLNVVVQQLGVNVEIALLDPKKAQICDVDWWWREGAELLWAMAESTGDYTIKVSASKYPVETASIVSMSRALEIGNRLPQQFEN
jgi:hypothetical protein